MCTHATCRLSLPYNLGPVIMVIMSNRSMLFLYNPQKHNQMSLSIRATYNTKLTYPKSDKSPSNMVRQTIKMDTEHLQLSDIHSYVLFKHVGLFDKRRSCERGNCIW